MTTTYTQSQIAQALMMNTQSEVVANIDRERHPSHKQSLQLFNIAGVTRQARLNMVYLPKEGELQVYCLAPMRVLNSTSNTPAYRNRVQWLQVSMDNKAVLTDVETNKSIVRNSNPAVFDIFMSTEKTIASGKTFKNPYNTLIVSGFFRLVPIPAVYNDATLIKEFNKCSEMIIRAHNVLKAEFEGEDLSFNTKYQDAMHKLYKVYQKNMIDLINAGRIVLTHALNAADSSLIYAITMDTSIKNENPYYSSETLLEHASYMPTLNEFFGHVRVNSDATTDEFNETITTGLRSLGKEVEGGEETINNSKRSEATRLASISDVFGNEASVLLRRQDQGYSNPNNQNQTSLAKIFDDNTANNEQLFITGKYFPIVMSRDAGSSANGITRPTVLVTEYTRHRGNSTLASVEASLGEDISFDSNDDELAHIMASVDSEEINMDGEASSVTFSAEESQGSETSVDASKAGTKQSKKDII